MALTREQAWELLNEYNKGEFHLKHGQIVGDVMRWYAIELGYGDEADFWETVGLLHDLDFEMYPDEHCIKSQEIMREKGLVIGKPEDIIHIGFIIFRKLYQYCRRNIIFARFVF